MKADQHKYHSQALYMYIITIWFLILSQYAAVTWLKYCRYGVKLYQSCPNMALYTSPNSRKGNATSTKRDLRECHQIYCLKVSILLVTGYKHRDVNQNTHRLKTD